jgi:hypothetical protein
MPCWKGIHRNRTNYAIVKQRKENKMTDYYKYEEIKSYFEDFINNQDQSYIKEHRRDASTIHHDAFNNDHYIIGRYEAKKWLGDEVFDIINIIKEYEMDHFGEVNTDFSEPERVVNMYTYIVGEQIVYDYLDKLNEEAA